MSLAALTAEAIRFSDQVFRDFWKDWPDAQACAAKAEHENTFLWTIGHLAVVNDWITGLMTGEPWISSDAYNKLFGMGSKALRDPKAYPPLGEVKEVYEKTVRRVLDELAKRTDAELERPVVGDSHGFAKTRAEAAGRIAWHIGWHTGQLATTRRGLGLKPVMG